MTNPIVDAICSSPYSDAAKAEGARLAEAYLARFANEEEWESLAVEAPFFLWLDPITLIVGVMDEVRRHIKTQRVEGLELKTRRAPKVKKDGTLYKGDTEQDWLAEISDSPQLSVYGLGLYRGTFVGVDVPRCEKAMVRVRAAIKSAPPQVWPTADDGLFAFSVTLLDKVAASLLSAAQSIRAHRQTGTVPWQMIGSWCSQFGRDCRFLTLCRSRQSPPDSLRPFKGGEEAGERAYAAAVDANPTTVVDGAFIQDVVAFSASSYQSWGRCSELYRLETSGQYDKEESDALSVGSVFHLAIATAKRERTKK